MLRRLMAILLVFALVGLFVGGCKDKSAKDEVGTTDQYREQAKDTITEKNAEAELDKLEEEIDADTE